MITQALTRAFALSMASQARAFSQALADPRTAQQRALGGILDVVRDSERGRRLGLMKVRTLRDLQSAAPLQTWADLEDDVERAAAGTRGVLTTTPLVRFERSSGSTGAQKLLPMTHASLDELSRALSPWLHDLFTRVPGVADGCSYWSISPVGDTHPPTAGGIAVGADDDTSYFPRALRPLLARVMATPPELAQLSSVRVCRYVTLRALLARDDLALISVWSPTFLSLLWRALEDDVTRLLDDVAHGSCRPPDATERDVRVLASLPWAPRPARARALGEVLQRVDWQARDLWPRLSLLSLWTDGSSAQFVDDAVARCRGVPVQGKGLLATEGVVSIPWRDAAAPVLAIRSHVLEFLEVDDEGASVDVAAASPSARALLAHELSRGRSYEVVLTTGAGLVRHRLGDVVRVDGFVRATPCVRFVGRAGHVCDLVGEKLGAGRVSVVLAEVAALLQQPPRFALVAPVISGAHTQHYRVFLDTDAPDHALAAAAALVEERLREGHPYRFARALGQLGVVDVARVHDGVAGYEARCLARGQRAGDIKPLSLSADPGWTDALAVVSLHEGPP